MLCFAATTVLWKIESLALTEPSGAAVASTPNSIHEPITRSRTVFLMMVPFALAREWEMVHGS
jgi:hypothetical protein